VESRVRAIDGRRICAHAAAVRDVLLAQARAGEHARAVLRRRDLADRLVARLLLGEVLASLFRDVDRAVLGFAQPADVECVIELLLAGVLRAEVDLGMERRNGARSER
jgi:hypothetical protein